MGRAPCCSKVGLHRGPWTAREDMLLTQFIEAHGEGQWRALPKKAGLLRCGKSCRLRWMNYLRPDIKRGNIAPDEEELVIRLHRLLGNRWSLIAGRLPGRTDNEIKNFWNTHLSKKLMKKGIDPKTHQPLPSKLEAQETSGQVKSDDNYKRKRRLILESYSKKVNVGKINKGDVQQIHLPKANRFIAFPHSASTSDLTGLSLTKSALESESNAIILSNSIDLNSPSSISSLNSTQDNSDYSSYLTPLDNLDPHPILPVNDCFPWPSIDDDDENWTVSNLEEDKRINPNPNPNPNQSPLQLHDDQNARGLIISQHTNSDSYVHSETKMGLGQTNKQGKPCSIMLQEVYEEYLELLQEEYTHGNDKELISESSEDENVQVFSENGLSSSNEDENAQVFSENGLSSMWDCLQGDDGLLNNAAETALSLQECRI